MSTPEGPGTMLGIFPNSKSTLDKGASSTIEFIVNDSASHTSNSGAQIVTVKLPLYCSVCVPSQNTAPSTPNIDPVPDVAWKFQSWTVFPLESAITRVNGWPGENPVVEPSRPIL